MDAYFFIYFLRTYVALISCNDELEASYAYAQGAVDKMTRCQMYFTDPRY
jgi:hypothetical protein